MKTRELTGMALDWAVAKCEHPDLVWGNSIGIHHASHQIVIPHLPEPQCYWSPSTDWSQGGPIIEREHIEFDFDEGTQMYSAYDGVHGGRGETHLIAAMRCYVASKLGDEVEIPEVLA